MSDDKCDDGEDILEEHLTQDRAVAREGTAEKES